MSNSKIAQQIRKTVIRKTELRLMLKDERYFGMADGKVVVEGDSEAETWNRLLSTRGAEEKRYFGITGARNLFLHHYPNGFSSEAYSERGERGYKIKAKSKLDENVPLEAALGSRGLGAAALSVCYATDLLFPNEKMRIADVLRGPDADAFIQAAAAFTEDSNKATLKDLERILRPYEAAKWTVVTYLPFLWRPESHMFLKPEATVDFAERTQKRFAQMYSPSLDVRVYESLLELSKVTAQEIEDLGPRDNIDIQSFIWVVSGAYQNELPRP
jgi:hypothetical protein